MELQRSAQRGGVRRVLFSATRTDGRHIKIGPVYKITQARTWPSHPAFDGQFRATVYTPGACV